MPNCPRASQVPIICIYIYSYVCYIILSYILMYNKTIHHTCAFTSLPFLFASLSGIPVGFRLRGAHILLYHVCTWTLHNPLVTLYKYIVICTCIVLYVDYLCILYHEYIIFLYPCRALPTWLYYNALEITLLCAAGVMPS